MRRTQTVLGTQYLNDGPVSLPTLPFSQALKGFEDRAREAFDELDDRLQNVMVYQAFEEFPTDLDELNEAFQQMFTHYANHPRAALNLIDRHLRNAFVVYVADRARNTFSEGNLWGNFFNGFIGLSIAASSGGDSAMRQCANPLAIGARLHRQSGWESFCSQPFFELSVARLPRSSR